MFLLRLTLLSLLAGIFASASTTQAKEYSITFDQEKVGADPTSFMPVVGNWKIGEEQGNRLLVVDGTKWAKGQVVTNLADVAKYIYGPGYAEFLDKVKAYAYFPFTVMKDVEDFQGGEVSVRFKPISG